MSIPAPPIEPRDHEAFARDMERLARLYAGWRPPGATLAVPPSLEALMGRLLGETVASADGSVVAARGQRITEGLARKIQSARPHPATVRILLERDLGWALIQLAARMAEQLATRVNRAPEKHLLAFLELIGARLLPATPARAPLSFTLAEGSPEDVLVPARTQVAAKDPATGDEIVFETEQELLVPRARLVSAFVRDPRAGATADRADLVGAGAPDGLRIFDASDGRPFEHALYLACDEVLAEAGSREITVRLEGQFFYRLDEIMLWQYWNGAAWRELPSVSYLDDASKAGIPKTGLKFTRPDDAAPRELRGRSAVWLRALQAHPRAAEGPGRRLDLVQSDDDVHVNQRQYLDSVGDEQGLTLGFASDRQAPLRPGELVNVGPVFYTPGLPAGGLAFSWEYRARGGEWRTLGRATADGTEAAGDYGFADTTNAFTRHGTISFRAPEDWDDLQGETLWLRLRPHGQFGTRETSKGGRSGAPSIPNWNMPTITAVKLGWEDALVQVPIDLLVNGMPVERSAPFHPFGERPRVGSSFFLRSPTFNPKSTLRLNLRLQNPQTPPTNLAVAWEWHAGGSWQPCMRARTSEEQRLRDELDRATGQQRETIQASIDAEKNAVEQRLKLVANGEIHLFTGSYMEPVTVGGVTAYWLRVRLTQGGYGSEAQFTAEPENPATPKDGKIKLVHKESTLNPPLIEDLRCSAQLFGTSAPCDMMLAHDDDVFTERANDAAFPLFGPSRTTEPALHLGLDRPLPNRAVDLFVEDDPVTSLELVGARRAAPPQIRWEYWRGDGWQPLGALDGTRAFAERGLVRFIGPADHASREDFGARRYWLRARLAGGGSPVPPRLRRVLLGTTWAAQASSVLDEPPAPSSGLAGQAVRLARAPVLPGERVEVFEPDLHHDELAALEARPGAAARDPRRPEGRWVRWREVLDFYGSGPGDRHYTLDRSAGELRFGDGRRGRVPPPGAAAIRAAYRTGGGAAGNLPAGAIGELKATIPFLDGASNPAPAGGGAAAEELARLRERAPLAMRHGDRAVTAADYEDLALAAAPDVARALALPPPILSHELSPSQPGDQEAASWHGLPADEAARHKPYGGLAGSVGLIVVPHSGAARPAPSLALLDAVDDFVRARCPAGVALAVSGPEWVRVEVYAEVVPERVEEAPTVARAVEVALARFLHPLSGGDGEGWTFGRRPHRSDFFALIEGVPGVDHVRRLRVREHPDLDAEQPAMSDEDLAAFRRRFLVYSGDHQIVIAASEGA